MVINRKVTGKAASMPAGLALGGTVSLGITLLLAAIIAKMVSGERVAEENIGYWIMALLFVSSAAGAMMANSRIKRQKLLVTALSGLVYMGLLLSITALFFGGQYEAVGVTALVVMAGSLVTALLGGNGSRAGKRRKTGMRHR